MTRPCSLDQDCWKKDGHVGPHAYTDRARTLDEIGRRKDEVIVAARLVVNEFLTRPASLATRHVERLDDLRNALVALGPHVPEVTPVPSVRESLERLGLPQTKGRIPPETVHPAPFDDDAPTPPDAPIGVEEAIARCQAMLAKSEAAADREITRLNARIVALNAEVLDRMDQWHRDSLARDELARQQAAEIARLRAALAGEEQP